MTKSARKHAGTPTPQSYIDRIDAIFEEARSNGVELVVIASADVGDKLYTLNACTMSAEAFLHFVDRNFLREPLFGGAIQTVLLQSALKKLCADDKETTH